jgi:hypothetical protein
VEEVTRLSKLSCLLLLSIASAGIAQSGPKFITFDRLCGILEFVTPVSGGGKDAQPLSFTKIELYPREEGISCCKNSHPFFKIVTDKDGAYEFKNVDAGRYWLVARYREKPVQVAVIFDPKSRTPASAGCWQQLLQFDSHGNFTLGIQVEM